MRAYHEINQENLTLLESELLTHFRNIWDVYLQRLAIQQIEAISNFDPTQTLLDAVDLTLKEKENEAKLQEIIDKRRKKTIELKLDIRSNRFNFLVFY